ncbi:TPA: hypothetical protein HIQ17_002826 [Escherichia coli]|uniref:hypothetical protein n=1 Tax=Escherichia coli TaxID=562 RepID=UPI000F5EA499|nr:hypothetical protein [Escherichia coli]MCG9396566.1 hypothetical protein [Escherichia coli]RRB96085.1 hypothetical protein EIA20_01975 [Escherichia coli]HAH9343254.1 hypothetical protein [Escherichia coli]HBB0332006.1 hypothetical protein [Escherichia coli]
MKQKPAVYIGRARSAIVEDNDFYDCERAIHIEEAVTASVKRNKILSTDALDNIIKIKSFLLENAATLEREIGVENKEKVFSALNDLPDSRNSDALDKLLTISSLCSNAVTIWPVIKPIVISLMGAVS